MPRVSNRPAGIWYMGAKSRLLDGFILKAVRENVPTGGCILDLFCGSGVVARALAPHYAVAANDALRFCAVLAEAQLLHEEADKRAFVESLDHDADLGDAYQANRAALESILGPALDKEARCLAGSEGAQAYLELLETTPPPMAECSGAFFAGAQAVYSAPALTERSQRPDQFPYTLITAYYGNVYFGLRQAVDLDSLRYAIDRLPQKKARTHYLSALLQAASVSTSGTSHFAQPTDPRKPREMKRQMSRRRFDIVARFKEFGARQAREIAQGHFQPGNHVSNRDFHELLLADGSAFRGGPFQAIYADPPYTADNYSRFYHVMEELCHYRYPELQTGRNGLTKGRYPTFAHRFKSSFCAISSVEGEWDALARAAAGSGAVLLASYSTPNGLLLKTWRKQGATEEEALERFAGLFRRHYPRVELRCRAISHSGQGDGNIPVRELLVVARP